MRHIVVGLFVAIPVVAACNDNVGPPQFGGTTTWALHADSLTGGGLTCVLAGTVVFVQNTATLTGNLPGNGVVTNCSGNGGNVMGQSSGTNDVNGTLNGALISFNLDSGAIIASGTVYIASDSMAGDSMTVSYASGPINVKGSWYAKKASP